jgi:hypothetical protein
VPLINGKLLTPLACSQWRLQFMLLDAKIKNKISSQFGCLKEFCIEWEKNQINELVVPPL